MTARPELPAIRRLLCALQDEILRALVAGRKQGGADFAAIAARTAADTIYAVDRISEATIADWFARHWPQAWPVEVVMEGLADGATLTFPAGTPVAATRWKCLLDPIDGTRNVMFDKRSGWSLAAVAPQRGAQTRLSDLVVAVMTELPTSKQVLSDQVSAIRGGGPAGVVVRRRDLATGRATRPRLNRSAATDFRHGFASVVKFFPEGKARLAEFEEALWSALYPRGEDPHGTPIFDDQYLSTGGQIYELLAGHDRMVADLRPLVASRLGLTAALACHPYDLTTALLLTESGGIVENPLGGPLRAPLDLTTPVAWVGFANASLARRARPVLRRLVREFF